MILWYPPLIWPWPALNIPSQPQHLNVLRRWYGGFVTSFAYITFHHHPSFGSQAKNQTLYFKGIETRFTRSKLMVFVLLVFSGWFSGTNWTSLVLSGQVTMVIVCLVNRDLVGPPLVRHWSLVDTVDRGAPGTWSPSLSLLPHTHNTPYIHSFSS